jgi:ABC-type glycerol-3-phosphate transport system substrate-binding protein
MRRHTLRTVMACSLMMVGLAACGSGGGGTGSGKSITIWEGYTGAEQKEFTHLLAVYEKANPGVKISVLYVNNDNTLQKARFRTSPTCTDPGRPTLPRSRRS